MRREHYRDARSISLAGYTGSWERRTSEHSTFRLKYTIHPTCDSPNAASYAIVSIPVEQSTFHAIPSISFATTEVRHLAALCPAVEDNYNAHRAMVNRTSIGLTLSIATGTGNLRCARELYVALPFRPALQRQYHIDERNMVSTSLLNEEDQIGTLTQA